MDLIAILVILALPAIIIAVNPTWIMKAIYGILTFFIGLLVQIEGITYNGSAIISTGTNLSLILMVFMTLGSLVTIYSVSIKKDVSVS